MLRNENKSFCMIFSLLAYNLYLFIFNLYIFVYLYTNLEYKNVCARVVCFFFIIKKIHTLYLQIAHNEFYKCKI